MHYMFYGATSFNQAIGNWNVSKVTNMDEMFHYATNFNQDLCPWYNKLQSTTTVTGMLSEAKCTKPADPDFSSKSSFCQTCTCIGGKLWSIIWLIKSFSVYNCFVIFFFVNYHDLLQHFYLFMVKDNAVTARKHAVQMPYATALARSAREGCVLLLLPSPDHPLQLQLQGHQFQNFHAQSQRIVDQSLKPFPLLQLPAIFILGIDVLFSFRS
jgi:surface protein